jgi:hypothetical protein
MTTRRPTGLEILRREIAFTLRGGNMPGEIYATLKWLQVEVPGLSTGRGSGCDEPAVTP